MPSTDITLCVSNVCPKKRDCAEWFGNNFHLPDDREYSHHDPYRPELGGCEWYRETAKGIAHGIRQRQTY